MDKLLSFEDSIINNVIGYGKSYFSFNLNEENIINHYERENKFLLYRLQNQDAIGILSLNTYGIVNINNFSNLLSDKNKFKEELFYAVDHLIQLYIKNYEYSKKYDVPINELNNKASDKLNTYYNNIEQLFINNKQLPILENRKNDAKSIYDITEELFRLLIGFINNLTNNYPSNNMEGALC